MHDPQRTLSPIAQSAAASSPETRAGHAMRAMFHTHYGPPSTLRVRDLPVPTLGADDVLVRVHAAGLHIGDVFAVRGQPMLMRLVTGMLKPRHGVPGFDVAGTVTAVGDRVSQFHVGDPVFGTCSGSCAEQVATQARNLTRIPAGLSFDHAAALPTSGLAALHALRDVAELRPGQRLLVNGAAGGVGVFAVQLGKAYGAHVTGVCSTHSVELVRSLGADAVIDYTQQDFTLGPQRYDVILDNIENRSLSAVRRALTPEGMLICNSGTGARGLRFMRRLLTPVVLAPFVRHRLRRYLSMPKQEDLLALSQLVERGALRAIIDRTYPLQETPAALTYIEAGHAQGKVVVKM